MVSVDLHLRTLVFSIPGLYPLRITAIQIEPIKRVIIDHRFLLYFKKKSLMHNQIFQRRHLFCVFAKKGVFDHSKDVQTHRHLNS